MCFFFFLVRSVVSVFGNVLGKGIDIFFYDEFDFYRSLFVLYVEKEYIFYRGFFGFK